MDMTGVESAIASLEMMLNTLKVTPSLNISSAIKSKLNVAYEQLGYLLCHWEIADKNIYFDYKIDKSLWGNNCLLRYLFEECITYKNHYLASTQRLFCIICNVDFDCTRETLCSHVSSACHVSNYDSTMMELNDKIWKNLTIDKYAFKKFIDYRPDNLLHCRICGTVMPLSNIALVGHINSAKHSDSVKKVFDFKFINNSDVDGKRLTENPLPYGSDVGHRQTAQPVTYSLNQHAPMFSGQPLDGLNASGKSISLDDVCHRHPSTVMQSEETGSVCNLSEKRPSSSISDIIDSSTVSKNNGEPVKLRDRDIIRNEVKRANNNEFGLNPVTIKKHNSFLSVTLSTKKVNAVKWFCQPCNDFYINDSPTSLKEHLQSPEHDRLTNLKTNLAFMNFSWEYCEHCNASLFCVKALLNLHNDFHSKSLKTASRPSSVEIATILNTKLGNLLEVHAHTLLHHPRKIATHYAYYCFPCDYFVTKVTNWDKHCRNGDHQSKMNLCAGCGVTNCNCGLQLLSPTTFSEFHKGSQAHSVFLKAVERMCVTKAKECAGPMSVPFKYYEQQKPTSIEASPLQSIATESKLESVVKMQQDLDDTVLLPQKQLQETSEMENTASIPYREEQSTNTYKKEAFNSPGIVLKPLNSSEMGLKPSTLDKHSSFMSVVLENIPAIKYFCQACDDFFITESFYSITKHENSAQHHENLKSLTFLYFSWEYCVPCNANLFCVKELLEIHNSSSVHLSVIKNQPVNSGSASSTSENVSEIGNKDSMQSIENPKKNVEFQKLYNSLQNLTQHLSLHPNSVFKQCAFYCYPCNYFVKDEKLWNKHCYSTSSHHGFSKGVPGCKLFKCDCSSVIFCQKYFYEEHKRTYAHQQYLMLLNKIVPMIKRSVSADRTASVQRYSPKFVKPNMKASVTKPPSSSSFYNDVNKFCAAQGYDLRKTKQSLLQSDLKVVTQKDHNSVSTSQELKTPQQNTVELNVTNKKEVYTNITENYITTHGNNVSWFSIIELPSAISEMEIRDSCSHLGRVERVELIKPNSANIGISLSGESKQEFLRTKATFMVDIDGKYFELQEKKENSNEVNCGFGADLNNYIEKLRIVALNQKNQCVVVEKKDVPVIEIITDSIMKLYPKSIKIIPIGSRPLCLAQVDSVLDLFIETENNYFSAITDENDHNLFKRICEIGSALKASSFSKVEMVENCIFAEHNLTKLKCRIFSKNGLVVEHTSLLKSYFEADERVQPLILVIKEWARSEGLSKYLTGYTISWMVINFLISNSVLKPANNLSGRFEEKDIGGWKCPLLRTEDDIKAASALLVRDKETDKEPVSIKHLLEGFFKFYLNSADFVHVPLTGECFDVSKFSDNTLPTGDPYKYVKYHFEKLKSSTPTPALDNFCILDPIELNRNVVESLHSVKLKVRSFFKKMLTILSFNR